MIERVNARSVRDSWSSCLQEIISSIDEVFCQFWCNWWPDLLMHLKFWCMRFDYFHLFKNMGSQFCTCTFLRLWIIIFFTSPEFLPTNVYMITYRYFLAIRIECVYYENQMHMTPWNWQRQGERKGRNRAFYWRCWSRSARRDESGTKMDQGSRRRWSHWSMTLFVCNSLSLSLSLSMTSPRYSCLAIVLFAISFYRLLSTHC